MTFTPSRPCKHPGCSALVGAGDGTYCPAHRHAPRADAAVRDRHRGSAASRGYDAEWQRYRFNFLSQWPLCLGVLLPTPAWSKELAHEFHGIREIQREAGRIAGYGAEVLYWLTLHPIYRLERWDVTKPATVVDHIIPHKGDHELMWSPWNHQPVTARAHNRKTATEKPLHAL